MWVKYPTTTPTHSSHCTFQSYASDTVYPWDSDGLAYIATLRKNTRVNAITLSVPVDQWHLFTVTTTPGTNGWKFYQNDILVTQTTGDSDSIMSAASYVGYSVTTNYGCDAILADVLVHNRVLSLAEIASLADPSNVMLDGLIQPLTPRIFPAATITGGTTTTPPASTLFTPLRFRGVPYLTIKHFAGTGW
jgi:hypothetical protein